jgi:hypothetical protein
MSLYLKNAYGKICVRYTLFVAVVEAPCGDQSQIRFRWLFYGKVDLLLIVIFSLQSNQGCKQVSVCLKLMDKNWEVVEAILCATENKCN